MSKSHVIFLYGPQTSGKTTRLLRMIRCDHGRDILMSGEDRDRVNNGREVCDVTLRAPKKWDEQGKHRFFKSVNEEVPVKHVLIDGAQFLTKTDILNIITLVNEADPKVPIILTGCRYYVSTADQKGDEIPISHFLLNKCDRVIPVDRKCDFCSRTATHFFVNSYKCLGSNKIVAVDPHLVCNVHDRKLRNLQTNVTR